MTSVATIKCADSTRDPQLDAALVSLRLDQLYDSLGFLGMGSMKWVFAERLVLKRIHDLGAFLVNLPDE